MKSTKKFLGIIALVAIIGFLMAACENGSSDSSVSKFEGSWFNRDPNNLNTNYAFFTFTDNSFVYQNYSNGQRVINKPGTFTFTGSEITFIPPSGPDQWQGWTTSYTINGNTLFLQNDGYSRSTSFIKE